MKKLAICLTLLALGTITFAGCGGGATEPATDTDTTETDMGTDDTGADDGGAADTGTEDADDGSGTAAE